MSHAWSSDTICSECGEELELLEEVLLLQVVFPGHDANGVQEAFIVEENNDYRYEPQFFHVNCWEGLWETFQDHIDGLPAYTDPESPARITECCGCGSQINQFEVSGMLTVGEVRRSQRAPNGESSLYFAAHNRPADLLCISCLHIFNQDLFEMWPDFNVGNLCGTGLHERCWRSGRCSGGCYYANLETENSDGRHER